METLSAHVTGFDEHNSAYTSYTTEVRVDGCVEPWIVAIRYSTFHAAYLTLLELEPELSCEFPPKGGLFWSPPPTERYPQLDAFLQATLAHFAAREFPEEMQVWFDKLLHVTEHLPEPGPEQEAPVVDDNQSEQAATMAKPVKSEQSTQEDAVKTAEPTAASVVNGPSGAAEEASVAVKASASVPASEAKNAAVSIVEEKPTPATSAPVAKPVTARTRSSSVKHEDGKSSKKAPAVTSRANQEEARKKKNLSDEQKRLRNLRRKQKRKNKANLKIRGVKQHRDVDGGTTDED